MAGESFITAIYTAKRDGERLILAPPQTGEVKDLVVGAGSNHFIASGAFLACTTGVQLSLQYAGVKGWMATRGLFLMRTEGEGTAFVSSYGALVEQRLAEGERFVLDTRYTVAFSVTMRFETVKGRSRSGTPCFPAKAWSTVSPGRERCFTKLAPVPDAGSSAGC